MTPSPVAIRPRALGSEDVAEDSEPVPVALLEAWDRIVPQARTLLGELEITDYGHQFRRGPPPQNRGWRPSDIQI
jgi:hypothetical protein